MKCTNPNCGHEIPSGSIFCPDCGIKISSNEQASQKVFMVNGVEFKMILVEHGSFTLLDESGFEKTFTIPNDYYIGEIPITEELWEAVMGYNPREEDEEDEYFQDRSKYPVTNISWYDCQEFIRVLNDLTGKLFYMPSEIEWEFAARGGNFSEGYIWPGSSYEPDVKPHHYDYVYEGMEYIHETKELIPNELGLYDMTGNAYEFCNGDKRNKPTRGGFYISPENGQEFVFPRELGQKINSFEINPNVKTKSHSFRLALH